MRAIFVTFPELDEYPTKDLLVPHPTEPGYWNTTAGAMILSCLTTERIQPREYGRNYHIVP